MSRSWLRAFILIAAGGSFQGIALAGDLMIVSAGAVRSVFRQALPEYSKEHGVEIEATYASTGRLREILLSGERADLVVAAAPVMDELIATGRVDKNSRLDVGRVGFGTVVRTGATKADVGTAEGLRQALIDVKRIAFTDPKLGGAGYAFLMDVAKSFGIADVVSQKGIIASGGDDAAAKVARGDADLTIAFRSEILAGGATLTAMVPDQLQVWSVYAAAIPAQSRDVIEARSLLQMLTGPKQQALWAANGWQPAR